jgi:hypothetical protein
MEKVILEASETKKMQRDVLALFAAMDHDFRQHLMDSFMWSEETLSDYLQHERSLSGDILQDAYSHLESLLARIESYAGEKADKPFLNYDEWIDKEYEQYKASLSEDREDISRLMDEGGVVAPGPTSPVDTMADDTLPHYNHLKSEFEKVQLRSNAAIALMQSPHFKSLRIQADQINGMIQHAIHH